jgi:KilA-N domain
VIKKNIFYFEFMDQSKKQKLTVQGKEINYFSLDQKDFFSLTDIAKYRNPVDPFATINNWMRSRSTVEFLGLWEKLSNPGFKPLEFERFKNEAGSNYFTLSPQRWVEATSSHPNTLRPTRFQCRLSHLR